MKKYDESKESPSEEWLMDNGGVVDEKEFSTEAEYDAYVAGLNDGDGWTDYHIIRHPNEPEEPESSCEESVWLRAGMTVQGSRLDIEKILTGDVGALQKLLEAGRYEINGETYIPSTVIEEYNNEHNTDFDEDEVEFHPCIDKRLPGQTLSTCLRDLTDRFIAELSRLPLRPDGWLPHVVYVEEEGDYPVYTMYKLEEIREDGSCVLFNPETGERFTDRHLYEINIDWLDTVLRWYYECCSEQGIGNEHVLAVIRRETDADETTVARFIETFPPERLPLADAVSLFREWTSLHAPAFRKDDIVKLTDDALAILRCGCGNEAADYRKDMMLRVEYNKLNEAGAWVTGAMDLREDDMQEFLSSYLRPAKATELQEYIINQTKQ